MHPLDQTAKIRRRDGKGGILPSIEKMADQFWQGWSEASQVLLPANYRPVKQVVMAGMGGSGLTAHVLQFLLRGRLNVPIALVNDYALPRYVNQQCLVIVTSYSGNTEESIAIFKAALKNKAKIFVIASGGELVRLAKKHRQPHYCFNNKFNFSDQPRLGWGYLLASQLAVLQRCGLLRLNEKERKNIAAVFERSEQKFGLAKPTAKNPAKLLAQQLKEKNILVVGAEFLSGVAHALANQINESAKNLAVYFYLPELDHHLIEGLEQPRASRRFLKFLFLESGLYQERNQQRFALTREVLEKDKIAYNVYRAQGLTKLGQTIEVLIFSAYLSFYLALVNGEKPEAILWVDYFKKRLNKIK